MSFNIPNHIAGKKANLKHVSGPTSLKFLAVIILSFILLDQNKVSAQIQSRSIENCTDGMDNDLDCLVDCADPDCGVSILERSINEQIKFAVGQKDFTSFGHGINDSMFNNPMDVHQDPTTGKVFVADEFSHRVLRFANVDDFILGKPAEAVLGQTDFISSSSDLTADKMKNPRSVFVDDSGTLWVADYYNARVLRFDNASSISTGASADGVLGQKNFVTREFATSRKRMKYPTSVYVDDLGALWVTDYARVLRFDNAASMSDGENADAVFGQSSFTNSVIGSSDVLFGKANDVVKVCDRLYVADSASDRIVWFDSPNTLGNGPTMDGVIGQLDFVATTHGLSQNQFHVPTRLAVDEENTLYVVDAYNFRVVTIKDITIKSFMTDFETVWNQPDFVSNGSGTSSTSCEGPQGIAILKSGNRTYVAMADEGSNRISIHGNDLFTDELTDVNATLPGEDPAGTGTITYALLSQPTIGSVFLNINTGFYVHLAPGTSSLTHDSTVTFDFTVTNGNSCVKTGTIAIHLSKSSGSSAEICNDLIDNDLDGLIDCDDPDCGVSIHGDKFLKNASNVYGQPDFTTNTSATTQAGLFSPRKIVVDPTSQKVFVLENQNKRVLRFTSITSLKNGDLPEGVLGQSDFVSKVAALSQSGCTSPLGMVIDSNGSLFVSDYLNHRILRYDNASSKANGASADGVLGQVDFTSNVAATTQSGLYNPSGMALDEYNNLYVACAGSSDRVLRYDNASSKSNGANANQVLGKSTYTGTGGGCTINTINGPHSVVINNGNLYLSDFMCRRIIIWDDVLSKANGSNADRVIGQPNFTSTSTVIAQDQHRGGKMSFNEAGDLILSDYNNNRILFYENADALENLPLASSVIGQEDFTTGTSGLSDQQFFSPQGTFSFVEGDQFYLAVCDGNNNRILFFPAGISTDEMTSISDTLSGKDLANTGTLTFAIIAQPSLGTVTLDDPATGAFTYTPTGACMLSVDSIMEFTYSVTNGNSCSKTSILKISVTDVGSCVENCNDGIDNNANGLIDCVDPDCISDASCPDNDGDLVNDDIDIDDDNDGILDIDEMGGSGSKSTLILDWDNGGSPYFLDGSPGVNETQSFTAEEGIGVDFNVDLSNIGSAPSGDTDWQTNFYLGEALLNPFADFTNESESYSFDLEFDVSIDSMYFMVRELDGMESINVVGFLNGNEVTPDVTTTTVEIAMISEVDGSVTAYSVNESAFSASQPESQLTVAFTQKIDQLRITSRTSPFYIGNPSPRRAFEILNIYGAVVATLDTDGDSVYDHLDLDSDNDGIFDVVEAGGLDPDFDGIIGTGAVVDTDNDGWSNSVDNNNGGTALIDDDNDGDLIKNRIDTDSDGDGCPDVIEAGFPDADGDGKLGGLVPPTVNTAGVVTSGGL